MLCHTRLSSIQKMINKKKTRSHDLRDSYHTYRDHSVSVSNMGKTYRCKYCMRTFPSAQGQRSHLAQVKKCGKRWQADLHAMQIHGPNLFRSCSDDNNERAEIGKGTPTDSNLLITHFPRAAS